MHYCLTNFPSYKKCVKMCSCQALNFKKNNEKGIMEEITENKNEVIAF